MTDDLATTAPWPLPDDGPARLQDLLDRLETLGRATGGCTTKSDIRAKGLSLHVTFDRKVDVLTTGMDFAQMMERAPALVADACRRLLAAHEASHA